MSEALVSVVIPCHNYGRFLSDAIESVLAQTHKPVEVIVVDDGSTDNSAAVAARYPVHVTSQVNRGVCAAVNSGVASSRGAFVMRLDADDVLAPTYIEEMLAVLNTDPGAAFAYSDGAYFGAASGAFPLLDFNLNDLAEGAHVTCLALIRRCAFEAVGGYDLSMARLRCEDWDLWLRFAERELRGVRIPRSLWYYRRHTAPSRNIPDLLTMAGLRRELELIAHLQDNHPRTFAPRLLLRRLVRLPRRLLHSDLSLRHAGLLVAFYAVMLLRLRPRNSQCG